MAFWSARIRRRFYWCGNTILGNSWVSLVLMREAKRCIHSIFVSSLVVLCCTQGKSVHGKKGQQHGIDLARLLPRSPLFAVTARDQLHISVPRSTSPFQSTYVSCEIRSGSSQRDETYPDLVPPCNHSMINARQTSLWLRRHIRHRLPTIRLSAVFGLDPHRCGTDEDALRREFGYGRVLPCAHFWACGESKIVEDLAARSGGLVGIGRVDAWRRGCGGSCCAVACGSFVGLEMTMLTGYCLYTLRGSRWASC
jgi:hypothetical protein